MLIAHSFVLYLLDSALVEIICLPLGHTNFDIFSSAFIYASIKQELGFALQFSVCTAVCIYYLHFKMLFLCSDNLAYTVDNLTH